MARSTAAPCSISDSNKGEKTYDSEKEHKKCWTINFDERWTINEERLTMKLDELANNQ